MESIQNFRPNTTLDSKVQEGFKARRKIDRAVVGFPPGSITAVLYPK